MNVNRSATRRGSFRRVFWLKKDSHFWSIFPSSGFSSLPRVSA